MAQLLLEPADGGLDEQLLLGELLISNSLYNTAFLTLKRECQGGDLLEELAVAEERLLRMMAAFESYEKSRAVVDRRALFHRISELSNGLRDEHQRFQNLIDQT